MSKTASLLALVAGATVVAQPVRAAEFIGPRIEARMGHDRMTLDDDYQDIPGRLSGAILGATVGYDRAVGDGVIVGVEATALASTAKASTLLARDELELGASRDVDVMARIGRKVSNDTLVYAKAGYAHSRFSFVYKSFVRGAYDIDTLHRSQGGPRLAVGVEHAFSDKVFGSAEYRHTDYSGFRFSSDATRGQILFGVGLRF
jgi:outer membrane immunogenic protein